ncbi:hypothetical protein N6Q81_12320, partial [Streptomyces vinaceusdrappus]
MPEGHTIHRLALDYAGAFVDGTAPRVTSPQGKFSDAAALLTRTPLVRTCPLYTSDPADDGESGVV